MTEFKSIETGQPVSSMEINRDGTILIVTYGNEVSFWDTTRYVKSLEKRKKFWLKNYGIKFVKLLVWLL